MAKRLATLYDSISEVFDQWKPGVVVVEADVGDDVADRHATVGQVLDVEAEVLSESVGPISVTYAPGARQSAEFRAVDRILAKYLRSGGSNIPMVRA